MHIIMQEMCDHIEENMALYHERIVTCNIQESTEIFSVVVKQLSEVNPNLQLPYS